MRTCPACGGDVPPRNAEFCSKACAASGPKPNRTTDAIDRFNSYVDKTDGCWNWTGAKSDTGYGVIQLGVKKTERAHRFAYRTFVAPISDGMFVLHRCDNRGCVRPDHLFVGTHQDNMTDMVAKGRQAKGPGAGRPRRSA